MITTTDNNAAEQFQDATDDDVLTISRQLIDQNKVAYEALGKEND